MITENNKIELARQSGYNEACFVKEKQFEDFIKKLKEKVEKYRYKEMDSFNIGWLFNDIDNLAKEVYKK